ncbi:hypothetical protein [Sphingosinicella sp. YJ22]|uniref:hypothetical protein n=1 Tax=Sphingosinicella sp. YJ22 TaxID=1104780 RepID=UPI001409B36B|nr:hypothetical protein [Sphingosinicella sp. YJ22]
MKLDRQQVATIRKQTGIAPIPVSAANASGLTRVFGEQTFYVGARSLYVFERVESPSGEGEPVMAIRIGQVQAPDDDEAPLVVRAAEPRLTSLQADLAA